MVQRIAFVILVILWGARLQSPALEMPVVKPKAFKDLQVIDHWNLRYHKEYDEFSLDQQVAQIKRNMDVSAQLGFTSYLLFQKDAFPELLTWGGRHEPDKDLRSAIQNVLDHAASRGLKVYLHCNEFMWPDSVDVPYGDTPQAWQTYRNALKELIALFPDLAGFEVTADETGGALEEKEGVLKFHNETARALCSDGCQRFALMRTWQRVGVLGSPATLGKTDAPNVLFSVKNTDGDFGVVKDLDEEFIEAVDDPSRLLVEFDAWREYETHNIFPVYLGDYWAPRFRELARRGVERIGVRFNWNSGQFAITERPWSNWINVFCFVRLAENPNAEPDEILREYVDLYYPQESHQVAFDLYKSSFGFVRDLYWNNGEKVTDHGRINRKRKIGDRRVPADWFARVDRLTGEMLGKIDALPDKGAYREHLRQGALVISYLSKACGLQLGAEGDTSFLDEWKRMDPVSFETLRADNMADWVQEREITAEIVAAEPMPVVPGEGQLYKADAAHLQIEAVKESTGKARQAAIVRPIQTVLRNGTMIELYPNSALIRSDERISGTANGTALGFEYFRTSPEYYYDVSYAWFAADGPVEVELEIDAQIRQARLRSVLRDIPFEKAGSSLIFALPGPGHYYLQLPDLGQPESGNPDSGTYTVLFIVDDLRILEANRMDPNAPDVTDISQYGILSDLQRNQTQTIQTVIEKAGNIYLPPGVYRAGKLKIPSGTTLYMAPGAVIQAPDGVDVGKGDPFLDLRGSENVHIYGPGTFDGNGYDYHLVQTENSRDIIIENALFRNCGSWAVHLLLVEGAVCRNVRVLSGKDGIDPDCAKDILIENCLIMSKDDAIAVKTRKPPFSTERVTVRNSIVASDASALKIGTETRALMRDITFERCDVFDSDRGIILYARDGGPIENVTWRNIRMLMLDWPHETGGAPFQFLITKRDGFTSVRNCLVENITTSAVAPSAFAGLAEAPLDGLRLRNITLNIELPRYNGSQPDIFNISDHVDVLVEGLVVNWQGHRDQWGDLCKGDGLKINQLMEVE
ncbi:MAG: hypothetical protein JXM79_18840 [Sedimentisphaerales bacterium]|nr:hypothetical protein [Sedimentisphaerales bacterium]